MADSELPYKEIAEQLNMPIGSIGPTRGRCLEHLRQLMEELELSRHVGALLAAEAPERGLHPSLTSISMYHGEVVVALLA